MHSVIISSWTTHVSNYRNKRTLSIFFFRGLEQMKPSFFLSSRSALAPDLELAVLGLRPGFFLESLPFFCFTLAWSRLPLWPSSYDVVVEEPATTLEI